MPRRGHAVFATYAIAVLATIALQAKPDFSQSTVTTDPAQPAEGDLVTFTVFVRNTGDQDSPRTEIDLEVPLEGMFVRLDGLDGAAVDPIARR